MTAGLAIRHGALALVAVIGVAVGALVGGCASIDLPALTPTSSTAAAFGLLSSATASSGSTSGPASSSGTTSGPASSSGATPGATGAAPGSTDPRDLYEYVYGSDTLPSAITNVSATETGTAPSVADQVAVARAVGEPADPAKVAIADRTHEYPSPPPPAEHGIGAPTPQAAVRAFADSYINWNAADVADDLRRLATVSVGQARAAMQIQGADIGSDNQLRQRGLSNAGTVEAVAPLSGQRDEYVVVTREATHASRSSAYDGLQPAWHLTIATVLRAGPGDWVISGWQPEN